jgi:hypothetical protein
MLLPQPFRYNWLMLFEQRQAVRLLVLHGIGLCQWQHSCGSTRFECITNLIRWKRFTITTARLGHNCKRLLLLP